jgi:hypothetical protein
MASRDRSALIPRPTPLPPTSARSELGWHEIFGIYTGRSGF